MKKTSTLLAVALGMAVTASAADNATGARFVKRNVIGKDVCAPMASAKTANVRVFTTAADDPNNPFAAYGELVPVMAEDFSKMKKGSFGDPYMNQNLYDPVLDKLNGNVWQSMIPGFTKETGWGAHNIYQAGGMAYMYSWPDEVDYSTGMPTLIKEGQQSQINPYLLDLTGYDPYFVVRFKAIAAEADKPCEQFLVEAAETNGMTATWNIFGSTPVKISGTEWNTYSVGIAGTGPSVIVSLVDMGEPVYLDDLEVYVLRQYVSTPVTLAHTNYTGTAFNANWTPVEGAESYLLTVRGYNPETGMEDAIIDHLNVGNVTTYNVTGVESGENYTYTVQAVKGAYKSIESDAMTVDDVETPAPLGAATMGEDYKYTASWNAVPKADFYNYFNYVNRTVEADGKFYITDENFDGVLIPEDGEYVKSYVTLEGLSEIDGAFGGPSHLVGLTQGGWTAENYYICDGFIGLCAYFFTNRGENVSYNSPTLDLSRDGGKFTLDVDLAGNDGRWPEQGILPGVRQMPQAVIAIAKYDPATETYVTTDQYWTIEGEDHEYNGVRHHYYNNPLDFEWKHYTINYEGATDKMQIAIFAIYGDDYVAIDNVQISQNLKAGDQVTLPLQFYSQVYGTESEFEYPHYVKVGDKISHQLQAVKATWVDDPNPYSGSQGYYTFTESKFSPITEAGIAIDPASVGTIAAPQATMYVANGVLNVNNVAVADVTVYDIKGAVIAEAQDVASFTTALPGRGVYMVKVGDKTSKVVY